MLKDYLKNIPLDSPLKQNTRESLEQNNLKLNSLENIDWDEIRKKLPIDKEDIIHRKEIFNLFDVNGNGYLSLAELDKGIRDILNLPIIF